MSSAIQTTEDKAKRLDLLLSYLETDPDNMTLREDAIDAALTVKAADVALRLIGPADIGSLPEKTLNNLGLAHMQSRDYAAAARAFSALCDRGVDDPAVIFNLAWARAMEKDFAAALALLGPEITDRLPQAAMLEVQLLHEAGEFDEAARRGERHLLTHPAHPGLAAAMSVLALDVENPELAERCARVAGDHPDALSTLGTLALGRQDTVAAIAQFDRALAANAGTPRAWVGRGLAKLISDGAADATADIDRGAELFEDHLGSWIAAGWAYLLHGDLGTARARFEKSMAIDRNFAENFGSIAVVDVLEGDLDSARRGIATALKLDRQSFSAMMAQSLMASAEGDPDKGRELFRKILETPINDRGETVMASLARLGLG